MHDEDESERLDLLADYIVRKMESLCGTAVRENVGPADVLEACGIPRPIRPDPDDPLNIKGVMVANRLVDAVFNHMALRWSQMRETDRRLKSAARPSYDDESEFD